MREFVIDSRDEGRRLSRWAERETPALSRGQREKYLRLKRFRVNGKTAKGDCTLRAGDRVQAYLSDESFEKPVRENAFLKGFQPQLRIVYEDAGLLAVDKKPGLPVHGDGGAYMPTLLTHIQAYLYQKGEYDGQPGSFAPALCNRIDRFTGGLVLAAKTQPVLRAMDRALREKQVKKTYLCIVHGALEGEGALESYLVKPPQAKKVQVLDAPVPGAKPARCLYRALCRQNGLTLVQVRLLTGYTHQIRAQFAHAGFPLLGDGQYGDARRDAPFGQSYQALCAADLKLDLDGGDPVLAPYQGLALRVRDVGFVKKFFPSFDWRAALDAPLEPQRDPGPVPKDSTKEDLTMSEKPICSNTHPCSCPNTGCKNHGRCCECVANHVSKGNVPLCMRDLTEQK